MVGGPTTQRVGLGGTVTLEGDGTEVRGPDGNFYRWDPTLKKYMPVPVAATVISSADQFNALPADAQHAILTGSDKTFVLVGSSGTDDRV